MSALVGALRTARTFFGYDAVTDRIRRKAPIALLRSEDAELSPSDRRKLVSGTRDTIRNSAIAGWMVRRHLDYITTFSFQAKTGNAALDTKLEALIAKRGQNCDVTGRLSLPQLARMAEARRTIDHDCFLVKLADGRVQPLEGDRILTPFGDGDWQPVKSADGRTVSQWIHGVQVDGGGRPLNYAVCRRGCGINQFVLDRVVPAANVYHHAHFERFDQVRGVSPLAATLNTLRDVYEGFDFALAKMKVSQLFGLSIYRQNLEGFPDYAAQTDEDGDSAGCKVDFGQGPFLLNLDPGDKAEFLESKSPSTEFQSFSQTMVQVALKGLDIPYSFYAENYTNYSGARQAYLQYEQSAEVKRCDVRRMLDWWTTWQIQLAIQDGELPGVTLDQISWVWLHRGMPWLDPLKEIQAEKEAIDACLDNPEDIAQRHGRNFFDNVDKIAACRAYAESQGVPFMTSAQPKEDDDEQIESNAPAGENAPGEGDQDQQGQSD